jgi:ribosomal protein S18 acetylase RimI-like enzyme
MEASASKIIKIRAATAADAAEIGRLGALLVALHHDFDADRFIEATSDTPAAYGSFLTRQLQEENIILLVAEERGFVLGYAYAGIEGSDYMALRGPAGVIYDLIVEPRRRREGLGGRLLEATLAALKVRSTLRVVLSTAHRNEAAQRLFARAGFRRTMIEMTRELDR